MFTSNINSIDRVLRLIIGISLLALVFWGPKTYWGYLGIILIVTAFINFCPLYKLIGVSTKKKVD